MQTILRSQSKTVVIDIAKPFVVIGEQINPTAARNWAAALQERDFEYVKQLAVEQVEAGADVLDVNVGVPGMDDVAMLPEVIQVVAGVTDVPICIDTPNPKALAAALPVTPGRPLVNSVNGEEGMLDAVLPLVKEYNAAVIGLTMDDSGIPNDPEKRLAIAEKIIERAARIGIPIEDVVIDPLVMTVGADSKAGVITLETIRLVREKFGVNINLGASNVSFGLP
jgi:5-methyltetrahydrofolate--homocysteine methyltransferase